MINLGDRAKDKVSGFTGIVVGRTEWLHGCVRVTIQPEEMKDGKPIEPMTFDELQLELVAAGIHAPAASPNRLTGGPIAEPKRQPDPCR